MNNKSDLVVIKQTMNLKLPNRSKKKIWISVK